MAKKKEEQKKPAIESIYSVEEKKSVSAGLIAGIIIAVVVVIVLILAAISMKSGASSAAKNASENYSVSILGDINAKTVSLPLLSVVLGLVDGFNPCAMWILVFLILMLFEMKDRKKMWILGSTFLLTSALVYLFFMVSWLKVSEFLIGVKLVRLAIGLFAIIFGVVNIYRFFKLLHDDDGCDVTDSKKRNKIMTAIKKIVTEKSFIISLVGIMLLAAGVNLLELLCSLGIPVMFTQILALNDLNVVQYMIYIILYLIFFMIDDFIVFIIAMTTLKITAISNKFTKFSHLIGGLFMALLGILMIFKPAWIMFNFESGNEEEPIKEIYYGDFIKDATIDDIKFEDDKINIYLFWGDGCPHCSALYTYLTALHNGDYAFKFNLYAFEVWENADNASLMLDIADIVGDRSEVSGVPFFIVGNQKMIGYAEYNESQVKEMIDKELEKDKHTDAFKIYKEKLAKSETTTTVTTTVTTTESTTKKKKSK